jgi:S1-C subfamily serine protease
MDYLDLIIIVLLLMGVVRGLRVGLFQQSLALVGFFGGLVLGALLVQHLVNANSSLTLRSLVGLLVPLGMGTLLASLGEVVGLRLRGLARRYSLGTFDQILGSVFELMSVLASVWLLSSLVGRLPVNFIQQQVQDSRIVQLLNEHLPPAPPLIARIEQLVDPNGFPKVFIGQEPSPPLDNPASPAEVQEAVANAGTSVVKIQGYGCGGIVSGSGFVVAPGLVATNAHVVAGVHDITISDARGSHGATPVWFDPNLDFAVLRTSGLAGAPLAIDSSDAARGTTGAILGFPGGGPFDAEPATVLDETEAIGRNIYDESTTLRTIYDLQSNVEPGNSGGPLVLPDGTVLGVVFAKAVSEPGIGYALTAKQIVPEIHQAEGSTEPVSVGSCASS